MPNSMIHKNIARKNPGMRLDMMQGRVYSASKAVDVAQQLTKGECGDWSYTAETQGEFGRVQVFDEQGNFVGYF